MTDRIGQQLGNYQIVSLLGQGGFADVYLGEHVYLRTKAAIKVLQTQLARADMEGFLNEARTIANLVHPNIVRVLEFGLEGNTPFLVMDYAPNGSLRQLHPKGVVLPLTTITSYVRQVAAALQYAHTQRLIHRDIKPENMLVGRQYEILLSDFGIALIAQSSRYESNQDIAGTVAYMSPEQIQGKPRPASDQYSLGVVVYEWLCGDRPFHGSFTELCTQHIFATPPPLHEKVPTIPPAIEQVVMTALAKDPKERFMSVQAFANALEQASKSAQVPLIEGRPDLLPTVSPSTQPGTVMPPAPSLGAEQEIATRPERNIPIELEQKNVPPTAVASPGQAVVSPPLSPIPPTERAAPLSPTPASTPQPAIILPTVASSKQEDYSPTRSDTPPPVPQLKPRPNYYRLIIPIAVALVLILGGVLVAPTLLKGHQTTTSPTPTTPATVHTNATPPLSALNPQQLYTRVTSGQPTLSDPLSAPDQNRWDQNTTCAFTNGMYQITNTTNTQFLLCMARNTNFANFAYQVQMTVLTIFSGNIGGGGLIFHSDQGVKTFYRFSLDNQGTYKLIVCQPCANTDNGGGTRLTPAQGNVVQNIGHSNTLTVIANNKTFYLYINGAFIFHTNDPTASAGEIGLYGFSTSRVAFNNLKIWALP